MYATIYGEMNRSLDRNFSPIYGGIAEFLCEIVVEEQDWPETETDFAVELAFYAALNGENLEDFDVEHLFEPTCEERIYEHEIWTEFHGRDAYVCEGDVEYNCSVDRFGECICTEAEGARDDAVCVGQPSRPIE